MWLSPRGVAACCWEPRSPKLGLAKCLYTFNLHESAQPKVVWVNATLTSQVRLPTLLKMFLELMLTPLCLLILLFTHIPKELQQIGQNLTS